MPLSSSCHTSPTTPACGNASAHAPLTPWPVRWQCGDVSLDLTRQGVIMGILNLTPDSFSDGGNFTDPVRAVDQALQMVEAGANIIDIGGESTRPGAQPVPLQEELRRVLPVLRTLRPKTRALLSIDTSKAEVARQALLEGADIINDVTALQGDAKMPEVVAHSSCGVVLMHMRGTPETMQNAPAYTDVVTEVRDFLQQRVAFCLSLGLSPERLCLDPGICFGKTFAHNCALLQCLADLHVSMEHAGQTVWHPLLLGISRKSFLAASSGATSVAERLWPGLALTALGREKGVRIFRVHDVRENLHALRVTEAILHYV